MIPVVLPLAFTGELVYRLKYFLENLGQFLPTLGRQFRWEFLQNLYWEVPPTWISLSLYFLLVLGIIGGLYIARYFYRVEFEGLVPFQNYLLINSLLLMCGGIYFLLVWKGFTL